MEERLKRQLDWSEPLATWLVRHSANCLSRYRNQLDGKTPDERRTGKRWRRQAVEFGEKLSERDKRGVGTFCNRMWRGTDRREDMRPAYLWTEELG